MAITAVYLYTDGACSKNPGPGSIGVLLLENSCNELEIFKEPICHTTNNRAEYRALIKGLDLAAKHCRHTVYCYLDSELVVKQLNGVFRLKNDELRDLFHKVKDLERAFRRVEYNHVARENSNIRRGD